MFFNPGEGEREKINGIKISCAICGEKKPNAISG